MDRRAIIVAFKPSTKAYFAVTRTTYCLSPQFCHCETPLSQGSISLREPLSVTQQLADLCGFHFVHIGVPKACQCRRMVEACVMFSMYASNLSKMIENFESEIYTDTEF